MTIDEAAVYVVDDDPLIRDSLEQLIRSVGLRAEIFSSSRAFLDRDLPDGPCCLILDMRMPGVSGLDLQDELAKRGRSIPIIFITGHGTVPLSVRAMKAGAFDFLQKPFEDQDLLDAIHHAIEQNRQTRREEAEIHEIKHRMTSLTLREREILVRVVSGMLNKQIADDLTLSENTIKTHRARIMRKMAVESFAELVRATEKAGRDPHKKSFPVNQS